MIHQDLQDALTSGKVSSNEFWITKITLKFNENFLCITVFRKENRTMLKGDPKADFLDFAET